MTFKTSFGSDDQVCEHFALPVAQFEFIGFIKPLFQFPTRTLLRFLSFHTQSPQPNQYYPFPPFISLPYLSQHSSYLHSLLSAHCHVVSLNLHHSLSISSLFATSYDLRPLHRQTPTRRHLEDLILLAFCHSVRSFLFSASHLVTLLFLLILDFYHPSLLLIPDHVSR